VLPASFGIGIEESLPDRFIPLQRLLYESILAGWFDSAMQLGRHIPARATDNHPTRSNDLIRTLNEIARGLLADPGFDRIAGKLVFFPELLAAFEFLRDRDVLTPAQFSELSGVAERASFTIAGVESRRALEAANELLARAVSEGWSRQRYAEELGQSFDRLGVTRLSRAHVERVFRTSIAESRSRAHDEVLENPVVGDLFPFDRYDAVVDTRSDPTHKILDGWVFLHADPIWTSGEFPMRPPRRPTCRCTRTSLSVEQLLEQLSSGAIHYGSGPITVVDADGKQHHIRRDRRTHSVLMKAKVPDPGPYSGAGIYRSD
jgi:hypothetical protein